MAFEYKKPIGMKLKPSFYELCKEAAWRERTTFASYVELALTELMIKQGYLSGSAGEQPGTKATP